MARVYPFLSQKSPTFDRYRKIIDPEYNGFPVTCPNVFRGRNFTEFA